MLKVESNRIISTEQAPEKRQELLNSVMDSIQRVEKTEQGYVLTFSNQIENLIIVSDWIQVERICNPFLRFNMSVESSLGPISCELSGPSGTQEFLTTELSLNRWL